MTHLPPRQTAVIAMRVAPRQPAIVPRGTSARKSGARKAPAQKKAGCVLHLRRHTQLLAFYLATAGWVWACGSWIGSSLLHRYVAHFLPTIVPRATL